MTDSFRFRLFFQRYLLPSGSGWEGGVIQKRTRVRSLFFGCFDGFVSAGEAGGVLSGEVILTLSRVAGATTRDHVLKFGGSPSIYFEDVVDGVGFSPATVHTVRGAFEDYLSVLSVLLGVVFSCHWLPPASAPPRGGLLSCSCSSRSGDSPPHFAPSGLAAGCITPRDGHHYAFYIVRERRTVRSMTDR